jgi:hypothetical protein
MSRFQKHSFVINNDVVDSSIVQTEEIEEIVAIDKQDKQDEHKLDSDIPDKEAFGYNLKSIKGYREKRVILKQEQMKKEFVDKVHKILSLIVDDETMYDYDILKNVIEMAEKFFIVHKKCGELKKLAVIEAVKDQLFEGNQRIAEKMIEIKIKEIWQSNILTKNKTLIGRFFLVV